MWAVVHIRPIFCFGRICKLFFGQTFGFGHFISGFGIYRPIYYIHCNLVITLILGAKRTLLDPPFEDTYFDAAGEDGARKEVINFIRSRVSSADDASDDSDVGQAASTQAISSPSAAAADATRSGLWDNHDSLSFDHVVDSDNTMTPAYEA